MKMMIFFNFSEDDVVQVIHQGVKTVVDQGESILPLKVVAQIVRMNPLSYPQGNQIYNQGQLSYYDTICVQARSICLVTPSLYSMSFHQNGSYGLSLANAI